jgi:hypothetical protein
MIRFKQIDYDTDIVETFPKKWINDSEVAIKVSEYVFKWVMMKEILIPRYKKTRSNVQRSNILKILEYAYGKFIFFHENFYGREPLSADWNPLNELNTKNVKESNLPISDIENLINTIYKKQYPNK